MLNHAFSVSSEWAGLEDAVQEGKIVVDGQSLTVSEVIAVSLRSIKASMTTDPRVLEQVERSVDLIEGKLKSGSTIYGVTTGFGGSADVRTNHYETLQVALQQHLNVGILLPSDKTGESAGNSLRSHALPVSVVRAMMLIRCNSLLRGHSGVRSLLVGNLLKLLSLGITPVVPLRGSISASGDLSPLSYLAGLLEGNPDIHVQITNETGTSHTSADKALKLAGVQPIRLMAKEGLGIVNGTATSCAAGAVAIHQAQNLAVMSQLMTAMATEALLGTTCNYDPFISAVRPHDGQAEAASNIRAFLSGSQLAIEGGAAHAGLAQDRYPLRTAPQWIGPQLEDLSLAQRQVAVELNSTTDNPLIDTANGVVHHGGNFQAASITSAMEKTTSALQMLGKLLYGQCSELINNKLNKGLPPNLSADDPSTSFTFKGFDVNMAAYMSELAYLSHPVSSHVQTAEMNNQAVNSLALVAARYAFEAVEVLSLMIATYLYALCQALDLRCLHLEWVAEAELAVSRLAREKLGRFVEPDAVEILAARAWSSLLEHWDGLAHLDLHERSARAAQDSLSELMKTVTANKRTSSDSAPVSDFLQALDDYTKASADVVEEKYNLTRDAFFERQTTPMYLSKASRMVYTFVRNDLGVPLHRGLADHPTLPSAGENGRSRKIIGSMASTIYTSMRDGTMYGKTIEVLRTVGAVDTNNSKISRNMPAPSGVKRKMESEPELTPAATPPSEAEELISQQDLQDDSHPRSKRTRV